VLKGRAINCAPPVFRARDNSLSARKNQFFAPNILLLAGKI